MNYSLLVTATPRKNKICSYFNINQKIILSCIVGECLLYRYLCVTCHILYVFIIFLIICGKHHVRIIFRYCKCSLLNVINQTFVYLLLKHSTCDLKDIGSLLGKGKVLHTYAASSSRLGIASHTTTPLFQGVPGRVSSSAAKSQRCDSPQFHSLSPNPSMIQASQEKGQEVSLANLFVPVEAIRPSEF